MKYYKIFADDDVHNGFKYNDGLNVDINEFVSDPTKSCCSGGLYFTDAENVLEFMCYGNFIREVEVPKGNKIVKDPDGNKYRAHSLFLHPKKDLRDSSTWEWISENHININNNYAICWASENGYLAVVQYLHEHGADITADDYCGICWASHNGHLNVVQYLHEHGASITNNNNYAVLWASEKGHLNVVKYLYEHGADITARGNRAIYWASRNGHVDVVKYLLEHGATLKD